MDRKTYEAKTTPLNIRSLTQNHDDQEFICLNIQLSLRISEKRLFIEENENLKGFFKVDNKVKSISYN